MVRTRAEAVPIRTSGAKAPRKNLSAPQSSSNLQNANSKGREHTGGNSYFPRETPVWQKPITSFFNRPADSGESSKRIEKTDIIGGDLAAGPSTSGGSNSKEETTD